MGLLALAEARLKEKRLKSSSFTSNKPPQKSYPKPAVNLSSKKNSKRPSQQVQKKAAAKQSAPPNADSSAASSAPQHEKVSAMKSTSLPTIRTPLDDLYELSLTGKIKIKTCAEKLNVTPQKTEEWARLLESHELVKIRYPALGGPIIEARK